MYEDHVNALNLRLEILNTIQVVVTTVLEYSVNRPAIEQLRIFLLLKCIHKLVLV